MRTIIFNKFENFARRFLNCPRLQKLFGEVKCRKLKQKQSGLRMFVQ